MLRNHGHLCGWRKYIISRPITWNHMGSSAAQFELFKLVKMSYCVGAVSHPDSRSDPLN